MMLVILLGILSSVAAEVVTALNKKLAGTVLAGDAAFLIAFGISFIGACITEVISPGFTWSSLLDVQSLSATFAEVFTVSQLYFLFVVKKLNLDVDHSAKVGPAAPAEPLRFDGAKG